MKVIGCFFKLYLTFTFIVVPFQPAFAQEFSLADSTPPVVLEQKNPELELALFKEKKDPWRATWLNLIPFGLGSFQQGDFMSGTIIASLDGIGALFILFMVKDVNALNTLDESGLRNNPGFLNVFVNLFCAIFSIMISKLIGLYAPYFHYESELKAFIQKQENEFSNSNQIRETLSFLNLTYTF